MAFVPNELVIPLGEKIEIALGCVAVFHERCPKKTT